MAHTELAKKIADDLFGGSNSHSSKAGHLRLYTTSRDDGRYMAGWSEAPMADCIERHLIVADLISRQAVADALAALQETIDDTEGEDSEQAFDKWWRESGIESSQASTEQAGYSAWLEGIEYARKLVNENLNATIASLGLDVAQE